MAAPDPEVLLLKPNSFAFSSPPPLNLMSLAAYLRTRGHEARVLDLGFAEDVADLRALQDAPRLFGVTATTPEFPEAARVIRELKERFPDVPVVIGGIHVSALTAEAVEESSADFGVVGEGEQTLAELIEALPAGRFDQIRGLIWRAAGEMHSNPPRATIAEIDSLPPPAWDVTRAERYFVRPWHLMQQRERSAFIMTSRGCPFGCTFCASHTTLGRPFRGRSATTVVDEIETLYRHHDVREFLIIDDNFTFDRERAAAICDQILRRGLDISWRTPNGIRIDTLDRPLLALMKKSGCYVVGFGIESWDRAVLKRAHKRLDVDRLEERIAMTREAGIVTFGYFIIGLPGESWSSALHTIRKATASALDLAHFGLFAPYPGSAEFERMRQVPGASNWEQYLFTKPFAGAGLSPRALKALLRLAYPAFYAKPSRLRLLASVLGPRQVAEAARILYHYMS